MAKLLVAFQGPHGVVVTWEDTLPTPNTSFVIGSDVVESTGGAAMALSHERVMPSAQQGTYRVVSLGSVEAPLFPVVYQDVGRARIDATAYLNA